MEADPIDDTDGGCVDNVAAIILCGAGCVISAVPHLGASCAGCCCNADVENGADTTGLNAGTVGNDASVRDSLSGRCDRGETCKCPCLSIQKSLINSVQPWS